MQISRKIKLNPNNSQKIYFKKAIGISRFTYNWAVEQFNKSLESGNFFNALEAKKEFNKIKKEQFPFVLEVTKYASQQPFININRAVSDFRSGKGGKPNFKHKRHRAGSFYVGGDQVKLEYSEDKRKCYLKIPKLARIRMRELPGLEGHINGIVISEDISGYYVSINYELEDYSKKRIFDGSVGIDLGLSSFATLSDNIFIKSVAAYKRLEEKLIKASRQLSRKQHPRTKGDVVAGVKKSNNYIKQQEKVSKVYNDMKNSREDFLHKLSTLIVKHYKYIAVEDLPVKDLIERKNLSKSISDASWARFLSMLQYKAAIYESEIIVADKYLPSSKMCSNCGTVKKSLSLYERGYTCEECSIHIDRDYNASLNILNYMKNKIGKALPELTPVEIQQMQGSLITNNIAHRIVESGKQCL